MTNLPLVRIKLRAALDQESERMSIHDWLDRWKLSLRHCSRTGGVWDERFEVAVPENALTEIPEGIFYCQLSDNSSAAHS